MSEKNMRYSIFGLGKLGASMAAAIAQRDFQVVAVDVDAGAVERVNAGEAPVQETGLGEAIRANRKRLRATTEAAEAVAESDVSFVAVPTPSDGRGAFSLRYAKAAFGEIGRALRAKSGYHVVVLTSTVLPGSMRHALLPVLESEAGKPAGEAFGLCYNPAFIALGSVMRDFLDPDFLLVGEFDARAGDALEACYREIVGPDVPCKRMSFENAELAKIAVNTFVTTKISFANMLAQICERLPGGDVDVVSDALGLDRRIGRAYLTGGLGFGGPCFPRDNAALGFLARALGAPADIAEATDRFNRALPERLLAPLAASLGPGMKVAVLGLAYKPDSHWVEESQGICLAEACAERGARVVSYDPLANGMAKQMMGDRIETVESVAECLKDADAVLVTTPDAAFKALGRRDFETVKNGAKVLDFWRILDAELSAASAVEYLPSGRGGQAPELVERIADLWRGAEPAVAGE